MGNTSDGPSGGRCSVGYEVCYDWEHVAAGEKGGDAVLAGRPTSDFCISALCKNISWKMPREEWMRKIVEELERGECRLLCKNCHFLKTFTRLKPSYGPPTYVWRSLQDYAAAADAGSPPSLPFATLTSLGHPHFSGPPSLHLAHARHPHLPN